MWSLERKSIFRDFEVVGFSEAKMGEDSVLGRSCLRRITCFVQFSHGTSLSLVMVEARVQVDPTVLRDFVSPGQNCLTEAPALDGFFMQTVQILALLYFLSGGRPPSLPGVEIREGSSDFAERKVKSGFQKHFQAEDGMPDPPCPGRDRSNLAPGGRL